MDRDLTVFLTMVARLGLGGVGRRYPEELRALALSYWQRASERGRSLAEVSSELGVAEATLSRWVDQHSLELDETVTLCEVAAGEPSSTAQLTLVSPSGYRIEGLSLAEVSALLESIG